jgi:hypothetical protein
MESMKNMHPPRLVRRQFLKSLVAGAAGLGLAGLKGLSVLGGPDGPVSPTYLPLVVNSAPSTARPGSVIHIHTSSATNWDFAASHYYGRTQASGVVGVNQSVVDAMVDRGVTELLDLPLSAVAEAWFRLTPDYSPGRWIAIKINLNNSADCASTTPAVDAIAQPVNAVVRGLVLRGVRQQDILLYDAVRNFPDRLFNELAYPDVQIHDKGCRGHTTTWNSSDAHATVHFNPPSGSLPTVRLSDTLINARYLINMPIMKGHVLAGVTLGFKNHFGSTNNPSGMHSYVDTNYSDIEAYNALVDLNSNPHIRDKTILTIGDGIYASRQVQNSAPEPWVTFNSQPPCSLFFATDRVAIDCVMHDLLKAERDSAQPAVSNNYLRLAEAAGLGIFESGDPWQTPYGSGYTRLDYRRIEI